MKQTNFLTSLFILSSTFLLCINPISAQSKDAKVGESISPYDRGSTEQEACLLYTSPSPRDKRQSRMPSSA